MLEIFIYQGHKEATDILAVMAVLYFDVHLQSADPEKSPLVVTLLQTNDVTWNRSVMVTAVKAEMLGKWNISFHLSSAHSAFICLVHFPSA